MYYRMLGKLEDPTIKQSMQEMVAHYENKDYGKIKELAHSLKGASGYIGASRVYYHCYFLQLHYVNGDYETMMKYYPGLVEAAVEFKVASRQLICARNNQTYKRKPDHDFIPVPTSLTLRKDNQTGEILCCRHDQSIEERRMERRKIPQKQGQKAPIY